MAGTSFTETSSALGVIFLIIYIILFTTSFIGNVCVLLVIFKGFRGNSPTLYGYHIGNLATADLLFTLLTTFNLIVFLDEWFGGNFTCKLQGFLVESCYSASILTVVVIGGERRKAVVRPLVTFTNHFPHRVLLTTLSIWIVSFILCSPLLYAYTVKPNENKQLLCMNTAWPDIARQIYYTLHSVLLFWLPTLFMAYTQFTIARFMRSYVTPSSSVSAQSRVEKTARLRQRKVFKIFGVITLIFIICWSPFIIIRTLMYFYLNGGGLLWKGCQLMIFLSSAVNPFIYGIYSAEFRSSIKQIILCRSSASGVGLRTNTVSLRIVSETCKISSKR